MHFLKNSGTIFLSKQGSDLFYSLSGDGKNYPVELVERKPGMFKKAAIDLDIDLSQSIMVGDHATDLIAAKNAGISNLYLVGEHIKPEKDLIEGCICYKDLSEMVQNFEIEKK